MEVGNIDAVCGKVVDGHWCASKSSRDRDYERSREGKTFRHYHKENQLD